MKTRIKIVLGILGLSCFLIGYHFFDPAHNPWAPKCPFLLLTGYRCPGCGSQRAIHSFLNGRIGEGIQYNYLLLPALIYVSALLIAPKNSKVYQALTSSTACWIWLAVIILWWIGRNVFGS